MDIEELNNLPRDPNQGGLYDIFVTTFVDNISVKIYGWVVPKECEMRIDLVSNSFYKNTKHAGVILALNNIQNPLSIKEGDIILYVNEKDIDKFKQGKINSDTIRTNLVKCEQRYQKGSSKDRISEKQKTE